VVADRSSRNFAIPAALAEQPLSSVLRKLLPGKSWGDVKNLIAHRHVQVNGNLCVDEARRLKAGEVIKLHAQPLAPPARSADLKIRFCDAHLLVVEKPAGLTTQRHFEERDWSAQRKDKLPTLEEMLPKVLAAHLGWNVPSGVSPVRRGPQLIRSKAPKLPRVIAVHRLDRDTSGLMIFARTPEAEHLLVKMFAKHDIDRIYTAVCLGAITEPQTIETQLVRDRGDGKRGSFRRGEERGDSQRAVTHIRPIEMIGGQYSIIECRLETGRTHQIRIHLSEIGHALCGDKIYRSIDAAGKPLVDRSAAPRQALHAGRLQFVHPATGRALEFTMPLPMDLQSWLAGVRAVKR